ncbi:polyprenol phosphomannose-dependent alpha 1,6 mannosyltransferase MptB [Galactobacter valiniphilus]|uniref:polyprenol phosphomannose-dependent alpha 1,6 mannosyltransferase MptB n=1 Tax=Galactobacter valiniphilus TaxID=2676122 RepID=UPI0037359AE5
MSAAVARPRALRFLSPLLHGVSARTAVRTGLVASIVGAIASWGVGFMPSTQGSIFVTPGILRPLRVNEVGVYLCSLALVLSAVCLIWAWLQLGRSSAGESGLRRVKRAILAWSGPWLLAFPVMSRDVYSYAAQGRLLSVGMDPYSDAVGSLPGWLGQGADVLWAQSSSPYGPLFLLIASGVQGVSGWRPEIYVLLFRALAMLGVLLCVVALERMCRLRGVDPGWALWIVVANPLFIYSMVASAHNDSLMVGLIVAAFVAIAHGRKASGLLLVAAAIAIKPIMVLALPFIGLALAGREASWRQRFAWWAVTGAAVGAVLAVLGALSGLWFGWIGAMADQGSAAFPFAPYGLIGLALGAGVGALGGAAVGAAVQSGFYLLGKLLAIGGTFWLALRRPLGDPFMHTGCALALAVVLNPVIQPWYLFWFLPFFVAYARRFGFWEQMTILLSSALVVWCLVDQLSLPDWVPATPVKLSVAAAGAVTLLVLVLAASAQRGYFRGLRFASLLRPDALEESVTQRPAG